MQIKLFTAWLLTILQYSLVTELSENLSATFFTKFYCVLPTLAFIYLLLGRFMSCKAADFAYISTAKFCLYVCTLTYIYSNVSIRYMNMSEFCKCRVYKTTVIYMRGTVGYRSISRSRNNYMFAYETVFVHDFKGKYIDTRTWVSSSYLYCKVLCLRWFSPFVYGA